MDKKEAIRQYKQTPRPTGLYRLQNKANGKILVESSKNLPGSINGCLFQLRMGTHMNKALQQDFNEFGEAQFEATILEQLKPEEDLAYDYTEDLKILKAIWLEKLQPFGDRGYNRG